MKCTVDASVLVAAFSAADKHHAEAISVAHAAHRESGLIAEFGRNREGDEVLRTTTPTTGAEFQSATQPGRKYRLEGTEDLASGQWTVLLDNIPGTGPFDCAQGTRGALQVRDPNAAGLPKYFYRIIVLP